MSDIIDFYIGTYTAGGQSKGIYCSSLDCDKGGLSVPELVCEIRKPSFLAIHPGGDFLYSVTEGDPGRISAFRIDRDSKRLEFLNISPSGGRGPCYVTVSDNGKTLFVANYVSGSVASISLNIDGTLGEVVSIIQHSGCGPVEERQEGPHVHSVNLSPDNRFAYVADLGIDKVMIYSLNQATGGILKNGGLCYKGKPGSGPRHLTFHPNGKFVYLINELDNTVAVLLHNSEDGSLSEIQVISTLPDGSTEESKTAEVKVHPNGKFLYGSNRGADSIVIYSIDSDSGKLTTVGFQDSGIDEPRHFNIDPSGRYCNLGNQDQDSIVLFEIDRITGELLPTGESQSVGKPICIKFL
jgi:6-phosphogluconolactonase